MTAVSLFCNSECSTQEVQTARIAHENELVRVAADTGGLSFDRVAHHAFASFFDVGQRDEIVQHSHGPGMRELGLERHEYAPAKGGGP